MGFNSGFKGLIYGLFIYITILYSQHKRFDLVTSCRFVEDVSLCTVHDIHTNRTGFICGHKTERGPGSVVIIATGYWLDGLGIESRWVARFSAPVHTGPGAHPASCTMGTGVTPGVKSGRGVTLFPHPLLVPWSWKSTAIPLTPPMDRTACTELQCLYKGGLYLYFYTTEQFYNELF